MSFGIKCSTISFSAFFTGSFTVLCGELVLAKFNSFLVVKVNKIWGINILHLVFFLHVVHLRCGILVLSYVNTYRILISI